MSKWNDVKSMYKDLGLDEDLDAKAARRLLQKMRATHHPDKLRPKANKKYHENKFLHVSAAIQFLDDSENPKASNNALTITPSQLAEVITQSRDVMVKIQESAELANKEIRLNRLSETAKTSIERDIVTRFRPFKFGGGFIAAVSALIITFKDGLIQASPEYVGPIFVLGISAGLLALYSHVVEQWEKEQKSAILSEIGFLSFIYSRAFLDIIEVGPNGSGIISMHSLVTAVKRFVGFFDESTCIEIANYFAAELENRLIVTKTEGKQLTVKFKIEHETIGELMDPEKQDHYMAHRYPRSFIQLLFFRRRRY